LIQKLHICHPKGYKYNFLITFMSCHETLGEHKEML